MPKKPLNKTRYPFLEGSFPENPLPYKRLNRKAIKVSLLSNKKGVTNKIRNIKKSIIEQEKDSIIYKNTTFNNRSSYKSVTPSAYTAKQSSQITRDSLSSITSNTFLESGSDLLAIKAVKDQGDVKIGQERNAFFDQTNETKAVHDFIDKGFLEKKMYKTYHSFISKIKERTTFDPFNKKPKNLYRNGIEKPPILATKYTFSLEQLKAEVYKKQSQYKKSSSFKNLLLERKKFSVIYGFLSLKQIQKLILQAKHFNGKFDENFIKIVESRLDVALYRISFFPTIFSAKQWINHGHVLVNKKVVTLPGYQLKAGDVISISSQKKNLLKEKISFYIAKKLKIRESHYFIKVENFITVIKNLVQYQNKIWNIYIASDAQQIMTPPRVVLEGLRRCEINNTFLPNQLFDEKQKRIGEKNSRHFEESRKLVNFFKKNFQSIRKSLQKNKIIRSVYLLPKVYPFSSLFHSQKTESHKIHKIFSIFYPFLKVKNLFTSARPLKQRVNSYKISGMKPLNIEVCYKNMVAIFLYSPQKVALPATIDLPLIGKSF